MIWTVMVCVAGLGGGCWPALHHHPNSEVECRSLEQRLNAEASGQVRYVCGGLVVTRLPDKWASGPNRVGLARPRRSQP